jgi:hypothetical protein
MNEPDILYHYCSADSFVSIVQNRTIRLSSLSLSNDSMEGRLTKKTVLRLANRDHLTEATKVRLNECLDINERRYDALGFCLSRLGDLLSQWRGYADDACGFSIGFGVPYLNALVRFVQLTEPHFALHKVRYRANEHESEVGEIYTQLRRLIDAGAFDQLGQNGLLDSRTQAETATDDLAIKNANEQLMQKLHELAPKQFTLKAFAFNEEKESRLVSVIEGNNFFGCEFRASRNRVIPFRTLQLGDMTPQNSKRGLKPIREVLIGPKNETPPSVVEAMLRQAGFLDVPVRVSRATYR